MHLKSLEHFFDESTDIREDLEALADPALTHADDRETINDLSANIVLKYLFLYTQIDQGNIRDARKRIQAVLDEKSTGLQKLKRLMERGWMNWKEYRQNDTEYADLYPLTCLADMQATAAIFKEIALNDGFERDPYFRGVDLGAGTGILMLAVHTAARRAGIRRILVEGMELNHYTYKKAAATVELALGADARVHQGDATSVYDMRDFLKGKPLHFWVSETISPNTPPLDLSDEDLGLLASDEIRDERATDRFTDPYPEALLNTLTFIPDLFKKARLGQVALFPDQANGLYKPNYAQSAITLKTGTKTPLPLSRLGLEFQDYEDLQVGDRRWL